MPTKFWSEDQEEQDHLEDLGIDEKIILGNRVERCGLYACGSGWEPIAGSCEHGNVSLGSIRVRKCLK
jgi:hypothetical protein